MIQPNIKKDKLIKRTEVGILIDGLPSLSFKDGKLYNQSLFHYNADLYKTIDGKRYYIFRSFDDCTLYIMNCNKEIYIELSKQIDLDDETPIFDAHSNGNKEEFCSIPFEYRKEAGCAGNACIEFNK